MATVRYQFASKQNTMEQRQKLDPNAISPRMSNISTAENTCRKRSGFTQVHNFGTGLKILGANITDNNTTLINTGDTDDALSGKVWLWNNVATSNAYVTKTMSVALSGLDKDAEWIWEHHFDSSDEFKGTTNRGVYVGVNGVNYS